MFFIWNNWYKKFDLILSTCIRWRSKLGIRVTPVVPGESTYLYFSVCTKWPEALCNFVRICGVSCHYSCFSCFQRVKKGQKQSKMAKRSSSRVKFKKLSRFVRTFQYETAQNFDKVSVKTPKTWFFDKKCWFGVKRSFPEKNCFSVLCVYRPVTCRWKSAKTVKWFSRYSNLNFGKYI